MHICSTSVIHVHAPVAGSLFPRHSLCCLGQCHFPIYYHCGEINGGKVGKGRNVGKMILSLTHLATFYKKTKTKHKTQPRNTKPIHQQPFPSERQHPTSTETHTTGGGGGSLTLGGLLCWVKQSKGKRIGISSGLFVGGFLADLKQWK